MIHKAALVPQQKAHGEIKSMLHYYFMPFRINAANNAENTNCPV